jgi:hypothetical protein
MSNIARAVTIMTLGAIVRLSAHSIAWPRNYSYSGPPESSPWGVREAALNDIGMGLFYLGGLLYLGAHLINQRGGSKAENGNSALQQSK